MTEGSFGKRIALWDNLKFFLVTCVVVGHFADQFADISLAYDSIFLFIYSFHIPLFIFISGIFYKKGNTTKKFIFFVSVGFAYKIISAFLERVLGTVNVEFSLLSDGGISWFMFALAKRNRERKQSIHPYFFIDIILFCWIRSNNW